MPIYVYRCANCDVHLEKRQGFADPPLTTCEGCGGAVRRVLQPVGVIFKGSGFYTTDYRGGANGKKSTEEGAGKSPATSDTGTDGPAAKSSESKAASGEKAGTGAAPAASGAKSE
jgi:putative FmdB family regulatory protein